MNSPMRKALAVLVLSLTVTAAAFAQTTSSIQGTVTDATGAALPNTTVTVKNTKYTQIVLLVCK